MTGPSPTRWSPPTWASVHGVPPLTRVRCPNPQCRRRVPADQLFDLRAMPETSHDFGCDACRQLLFSGIERPARRAPGEPRPPRDRSVRGGRRVAPLDALTYLVRVGAPPEAQARLIAKLEAQAAELARRASMDAGSPGH